MLLLLTKEENIGTEATGKISTMDCTTDFTIMHCWAYRHYATAVHAATEN